MKTIERRAQTAACAALSIAALFLLIVRFAGFTEMRGDLVTHYLLVDEIMKHGHVRAASAYNLNFLEQYPSGSHWLAAIVGRVQGSGFYGIAAVSIISVFAVYLMILWLVGTAPLSLVAFGAIVGLIGTQHSLVGWEISDRNYFYPQLVADLFNFGALIAFVKLPGLRGRAIATIVIGAVAMSFQPLNALHVLATGCMLIGYVGIQDWIETRRFPRGHVIAIAAIIAVTLLLIRFHPAFAMVRKNADHNGELTFGYTQLLPVVLLCAAISVANLVRYFIGRAESVDAVLGTAGLASVSLVGVQYAALVLQHAGSDYAVKKHMFLIVTIASISAARMIGAAVPIKRWSALIVLSPLLAGAMTFLIARKFDTPIQPLEKVFADARQATKEIPGFRRGDVVAMDDSLPPLINLAVTLGEFEHAFYWFGDDMLRGARYVMVQRDRGANCGTRYAETADRVVIPVDCLHAYRAGQTLVFKQGETGHYYLGRGWSVPDDAGIWTVGNSGAVVGLNLVKGSPEPKTMTVTADTFVSTGRPEQQFDVVVNGQKVATWSIDIKHPMQTLSAPIPAEGKSLRIVFKPLNPISPSAIDPTQADSRILGLRLRTLTLE